MSRFKIYAILVSLGWAFRLFWDVNHYAHWLPSGDFFYGVGVALIILGLVIRVDSIDRHGWRKIFTKLVLFTAICNLCDELFFDPLRASWHEWVTALIVAYLLYLHNKRKDELLAGNSRRDRH
jgi:lipoprotein signal peptidase